MTKDIKLCNEKLHSIYYCLENDTTCFYKHRLLYCLSEYYYIIGDCKKSYEYIQQVEELLSKNNYAYAFYYPIYIIYSLKVIGKERESKKLIEEISNGKYYLHSKKIVNSCFVEYNNSVMCENLIKLRWL